MFQRETAERKQGMSTQGRAQFTPGPWIAASDEVRTAFHSPVTKARSAFGDGLTVASTSIDDRIPKEEQRGNAVLLAAAPAMYEVLQAMLDGILYTRGAPMPEDRWKALTTIARQAIAQAEGR